MRVVWGSILSTVMMLVTTSRGTAAGTTIQPMHTIWFEESTDIASATFAPDGSVVYVHLRPEVIDVWDVAVQYWPEVIGVVSLVITLVAGLLVWSVLRRPRQPGLGLSVLRPRLPNRPPLSDGHASHVPALRVARASRQSGQATRRGAQQVG